MGTGRCVPSGLVWEWWSQSVGLSEEEKVEQAALRKEYIETIRTNMRANLNSISIREQDGSITDLGKKYGGIQDEQS